MAMRSSRSPAQWFCLVGGAILLVRGAVGVGLDPSFGTPGEGWHQLIHMTSGAVLLAVARNAGMALATTLAFGVLYAGVALVGIADGETVFGLIGVETSDNVIHSVITLAALGTGLATLLGRRSPAEAPA